jgi:DNA-binding transcriptional MerR regulator
VITQQGEGAPERSFLSIREVLDLLVEEFPDVTISKIRFLESRGLIHPERTASGYRKFYGSDVERLRWILREQREHFLPLKVIKGRLEQSNGEPGAPYAPSLFDEDFTDPPDEARELVEVVTAPPGGMKAAGSTTTAERAEFDEFFQGGSEDDLPARQLDEDLAGESGGSPEASPVSEEPPTRRRGPRASRVAAPPPSAAPGAPVEETGRKPAARRPGGRPPRGGSPGPGGRARGYNAEELATAAGVEVALVAELDEYGLIGVVEAAGERAYRAEALEVVRLAAAFGRFGVGPRHLRTFKHAAEREAGLFSQVVTPLFYQRNPEAHARAKNELRQLVELGASLHEAFVRAAIDDLGRDEP